MRKREPSSDKLVNVATIRMDEQSAKRVASVLRDANIPAVVAGSLAYGVQVRERDRERALSVLEKDAKHHGYWIRLNR